MAIKVVSFFLGPWSDSPPRIALLNMFGTAKMLPTSGDMLYIVVSSDEPRDSEWCKKKKKDLFMGAGIPDGEFASNIEIVGLSDYFQSLLDACESKLDELLVTHNRKGAPTIRSLLGGSGKQDIEYARALCKLIRDGIKDFATDFSDATREFGAKDRVLSVYTALKDYMQTLSILACVSNKKSPWKSIILIDGDVVVHSAKEVLKSCSEIAYNYSIELFAAGNGPGECSIIAAENCISVPTPTHDAVHTPLQQHLLECMYYETYQQTIGRRSHHNSTYELARFGVRTKEIYQYLHNKYVQPESCGSYYSAYETCRVVVPESYMPDVTQAMQDRDLEKIVRILATKQAWKSNETKEFLYKAQHAVAPHAVLGTTRKFFEPQDNRCTFDGMSSGEATEHLKTIMTDKQVMGAKMKALQGAGSLTNQEYALSWLFDQYAVMLAEFRQGVQLALDGEYQNPKKSTRGVYVDFARCKPDYLKDVLQKLDVIEDKKQNIMDDPMVIKPQILDECSGHTATPKTKTLA